jgi:lipoate-protein ligase B
MTPVAPEEEARELLITELGVMRYGAALELQRSAARARITGELSQDLLLLVEHPPVVTMGRSARQKNLVASPELLEARGVELFEVERGGDVTFHGPGQLVVYPIISLRRHRQDLHWYLRELESTLIRALAEVGVAAESREGLTGVWTSGRKIASIGVHARDWVTWHGFALNVNTDLRYFDFIVPCGIDGVAMTSVAKELGVPTADAAMVSDAVSMSLAAALHLRTVPCAAANLAAILGTHVSGAHAKGHAV